MDPIEFHRFHQELPGKRFAISLAQPFVIDAYRAIAFPAMKAYFYYNDTEKAVEAGAWHLFILAVLPEKVTQRSQIFLSMDLPSTGYSAWVRCFRGMEDERQAILTRTAELLREADHHLQAEYIESYRSPQMQRILEAGVLAEIETSNKRYLLQRNSRMTLRSRKEVGDGIYFQVNQPAGMMPHRRVSPKGTCQ